MKRVVFLLLCIVLSLASLPVCVSATSKTKVATNILSPIPVTVSETGFPFSGGSGTEADPYIISTKEDLDNVRNNLDAHYKMISDIVFTDADFSKGGDYYNDGKRWAPIGENGSDGFGGVFDGNGYSVQNISVKMQDHAGLFSINQGTIKNLSVVNVNIEAEAVCTPLHRNVTAYAGSIAAFSSGAITNCFSSGDVSIRASIGGTNVGTFSATIYAGGIVGNLGHGGRVDNCFSDAVVTALNHVSRSNSYAGGISGISNGIIKSCYSTGCVNALYSGGITGNLTSTGMNEYCYYSDSLKSGIGYGLKQDDPCVKCTSMDFRDQNTFVGFDFDTIWTYEKLYGYELPVLQKGYTPGGSSLLGHNYVPSVTAPTCAEDGYTTYTCSRCEDVYVEETEALGHTPGDPIRENESIANCTKAGSYCEAVYCSVCEIPLSRTTKSIDPLGHDYIYCWSGTNQNGTFYSICSRCGEKETEFLSYTVKNNTLTFDGTGVPLGLRIMAASYDINNRFLSINLYPFSTPTSIIGVDYLKVFVLNDTYIPMSTVLLIRRN